MIFIFKVILLADVLKQLPGYVSVPGLSLETPLKTSK